MSRTSYSIKIWPSDNSIRTFHNNEIKLLMHMDMVSSSEINKYKCKIICQIIRLLVTWIVMN